MKWDCWLFPWLCDEPAVKRILGDSIATKKLIVGSIEFDEAVKTVSEYGGGEIRLIPHFSKVAIEKFNFYRVLPKKVFSVSDHVFGLNLDYAEGIEPYYADEYGVYKDRRKFFSNKPNLKENQFSALDFSDHLLAPVGFELRGAELFPLQLKNSETWPWHRVLNTQRLAKSFIRDESVELVESDAGYQRPNFQGLMTLKLEEVESLGSLFKLPGSTDIGDSFWGCSKEFYSHYQESGFIGLHFQPILLSETDAYHEYISDWKAILSDLNKLATWKSKY